MYVCCVCIFLIERNAFDFDNLIKSYSKHSSIVVAACNKRSYEKSVFCMKKKHERWRKIVKDRKCLYMCAKWIEWEKYAENVKSFKFDTLHSFRFIWNFSNHLDAIVHGLTCSIQSFRLYRTLNTRIKCAIDWMERKMLFIKKMVYESLNGKILYWIP